MKSKEQEDQDLEKTDRLMRQSIFKTRNQDKCLVMI